MYKNHGKKCIKSDFKEMFLKLVVNDRSDKRCMLTCGYIHLLNHEKMCIKSTCNK